MYRGANHLLQAAEPHNASVFYQPTYSLTLYYNPQVVAAPAPTRTKPQPMVPYKPRPEQLFWCRELDGGYSLRTHKNIAEDLQPRVWQYGDESYPYFVRQEKN